MTLQRRGKFAPPQGRGELPKAWCMQLGYEPSTPGIPEGVDVDLDHSRFKMLPRKRCESAMVQSGFKIYFSECA